MSNVNMVMNYNRIWFDSQELSIQLPDFKLFGSNQGCFRFSKHHYQISEKVFSFFFNHLGRTN